MTDLNVAISRTEVGHSPSLDISSLCHTVRRCVEHRNWINWDTMLRLYSQTTNRLIIMSDECTVSVCYHWLTFTCSEDIDIVQPVLVTGGCNNFTPWIFGCAQHVKST